MPRRTVREQVRPVWTACKIFVERWWFWILAVFLAVLIGWAVIWAGYWFLCTGFGLYAPDPTEQPDPERAKTLWDWMDLLLVPAILAGGATLYAWTANRREQRIEDRRLQDEQRIEEDRARESSLQAYLDSMAGLLQKGLLRSKPGDADRSIARSRTLTVLRQLDGERKGMLIQFLYESELIGMPKEPEGEEDQEDAIVVLRGADLVGSDLVGVNLVGALLCGANLSDAYLVGAYLQGAKLEDAGLGGAELYEADRPGAKLSGAYLEGAYLEGADLRGADLQGATVSSEQLAQARSLGGAILPDGTVHE